MFKFLSFRNILFLSGFTFFGLHYAHGADLERDMQKKNMHAKDHSQQANESNEAGADTLFMALDRAKVLRITQPISTIVIGNPSIADASLPDERTLILTGRSYGETNILMLDEDGVIVSEYNVHVGNQSRSKIAVYRRSNRTTLSCTPNCEPSPTLGDENESYSQGVGQIQNRNGLASGFANGTANNSGL